MSYNGLLRSIIGVKIGRPTDQLRFAAGRIDLNLGVALDVKFSSNSQVTTGPNGRARQLVEAREQCIFD
jgi:hypothetical protein